MSRVPVSVVLPVYQPNAHFVTALRSVLLQDPGADRMQIAVVDDASPDADIEDLVRRAGARGRVEIHRSGENRGLAANWNECIRRARGAIVHILHQDDRVAQGFYERLLPAFENQDVGMAFCRHDFVDEQDRKTRRSHREQWRRGRLRNWLPRIAERQRIQCPAVLVRRSVYEELGGYRPDLRYALDWEMWVRIAAHFNVWYEPRVLAYYRRHAQSATQRLRDDGQVHHDMVRAIEAFSRCLPAASRDRVTSGAYAAFARRTLKQMSAVGPSPGPAVLEAVQTALDRITHSRRVARGLRESAERLQKQ